MWILRPRALSSTIADTHGTVDEETMEIKRKKSQKGTKNIVVKNH